jgi:hypothetical protein
MPQRKLFLKVAAVAVAVGLGGSLIAYRAGAFHSVSPAPQSHPELQPVAESQPAPASPPVPSIPSHQLMYSSKSAPAIEPSALQTTPEGTTVPPIPQPILAPNQPQPQNPPTFIGGSKSTFVFDPARDSKATEPPKMPPPVLPNAPTQPPNR